MGGNFHDEVFARSQTANRAEGSVGVLVISPYPPASKSTEWTLRGLTVNKSKHLNIVDIKESFGPQPKPIA